MYVIVRLMICLVLLFCSIIIIKKTKTTHRFILYSISTCISIALSIVLAFLPFENLFVTFDSPKSAYEYYNLGKSNIELIVEGDNCDFIVDHKSDSDTYLIIPKTENGWKIGIGPSTKRIVNKSKDSIVLHVFQYKNTSDYFVTVTDTRGGKSTVADNYNTKFYSIEKNDDYLNKTFVTYYAHITSNNQHYSVTVNDVIIELEN